MTETTTKLNEDLELFAKRLSRGRKLRHSLQHSPTADELAHLKQALDLRLQSGSMDLKLLALEWRYDVALLLDHLRHWMYEVDRNFSH
ncbi:hypothetical protein [Rhizobium sp. BR 362]|uniref:hypothetical protein n=1 Tax=Rhizobium sp. BR 362 TaxID=3040670 RepID=UPI002F3E936D